MKNICVFLSASDVAEKYVQLTVQLGELLVKNNYNLVYGGSERGLMKVMADTVQAAGGSVIGVTVEFLKDRRKLDATEMTICADLPERKKVMSEKSDAIVVLVGGTGTLDEVTELIELKKHSEYNKPIIFLNTDNFYEGLKIQLARMEEEGFLTKKLSDLVTFVNTPEEVIKFLMRN